MIFSGGVFTHQETHGRVLRPANRVIAQSQDWGWRSLYAAIFEEAPLETSETAVGHPSLIYHISRPTEVTRTIDGGRTEKELIGPRRISLTPGESVVQWHHEGRPKILQLYIRNSLYQSAFRDMYGCDVDHIDVAPQFAITDPLLEQLAFSVVGALNEGQIEDGLYVDSLAQMIAVHLVRHYAPGRSEGALPKTGGRWGPKINRLLEFIEEKLSEDLSLDSLAAELDISQVHLTRVFRKVVGTSPHKYVLERRLERAKYLLLNCELSIGEIALATGFCSQSHLANSFRRNVGVSPGMFRDAG